MRVVSLQRTALFIATCMPAALGQITMQCKSTHNTGGYAYEGTIAACGELFREFSTLSNGEEYAFPAVEPRGTWDVHEHISHSHCRVRPRDFYARKTPERIPIGDILDAIETLRWGCTDGKVDIGQQWEVMVATENRVGKRYGRDMLPSREVSHTALASLKTIARRGPQSGNGGGLPPYVALPPYAGPPPTYHMTRLTRIAIESIGIAGLMYAQFRSLPVPPNQFRPIPLFQINNEGGVITFMGRLLFSRMEANRGNHETLTIGPRPVSLQGYSTVRWYLYVRLELPRPRVQAIEWHWSHPITLLSTPSSSSPFSGGHRLGYLLREAFAFLAENERTQGFFIWQLNAEYGAIPEDEAGNLPDIGPYVRIFVERVPNTPTPTTSAENPTTD